MSKSILIIEDDLDVLEIMAYILEGEGYQIIASQDFGPIRQVAVLRPDLILIDNRLPGGFGKDECRKLKADKDTANIPVILVSANCGLEEMALESQANGFLSKPFDIFELINMARLWV